MKRKSYPDDCECNARDRRTCQQACKPTRDAAHRKHIKENRGGRDDRPAGTPGATPTRRTKWPLGKPLVVHMTEARIAANARAADERTAAEKWQKISGLIFIHPCDFHIGQDVHWHRAGKTLHGTVVKINDDMLRPAKVLRRGPVRYHYTPSVYDFCDKNGDKPCVCDLPTGERSECQHKPDCPVPGMRAIFHKGRERASVNAPQLATVDQVKGDKRWYVRVCGLDQARFESKGDAEIWADGWNAALGIAEPGVKLMQSHSPAVLGGVYVVPHNTGKARLSAADVVRGASHNAKVKPGMSIQGSLIGPDEYATRGAIDKQIKVRQAAERVMHNGWYTHGCGQWVHDQFSPCSVCPRPRQPRKKK